MVYIGLQSCCLGVEHTEEKLCYFVRNTWKELLRCIPKCCIRSQNSFQLLLFGESFFQKGMTFTIDPDLCIALFSDGDFGVSVQKH